MLLLIIMDVGDLYSKFLDLFRLFCIMEYV
jgi:hypothetical protein